ncbi:MAG: SET domain-containing protein, partial [Pseudomonadota bacterium]
SAGKGLGVFAEKDVGKGTTIWRHVSGQYKVLDKGLLEALLAELSHKDAVYLLTHITSIEEFPGYMVEYFDEGALINHSDRPNVKGKSSAPNDYKLTAHSISDIVEALQSRHFDLVAAYDIAAEEELSMDYNDEPDDPAYYDEACRRYGVTWDWL